MNEDISRAVDETLYTAVTVDSANMPEDIRKLIGSKPVCCIEKIDVHAEEKDVLSD